MKGHQKLFNPTTSSKKLDGGHLGKLSGFFSIAELIVGQLNQFLRQKIVLCQPVGGHFEMLGHFLLNLAMKSVCGKCPARISS